ncbi:13950_t:CDS:1, partial [Racocetra fulgida]
MPYKDKAQKREHNRKWMAEQRQKDKGNVGPCLNAKPLKSVGPVLGNEPVGPEPDKKVGPTNPKIIKGKEYVFIE